MKAMALLGGGGASLEEAGLGVGFEVTSAVHSLLPKWIQCGRPAPDIVCF